MLYETLSQGWEFAAMALAGVIMGAAALVFCGIRRLMCVGKWGCLACDCVMGAVWAGIGCAALFMACRGAARMFHFLAMASGAALFCGLVSPAARLSGGKICRAAGRIAGKITGNRVFRAVFR